MITPVTHRARKSPLSKRTGLKNLWRIYLVDKLGSVSRLEKLRRDPAAADGSIAIVSREEKEEELLLIAFYSGVGSESLNQKVERFERAIYPRYSMRGACVEKAYKVAARGW